MDRTGIINYLAEEAIEDRLVVFLGAGCSKWAGLPSWDELLVELRDKVGLRTRETNLLRLALRLEKTMKPLPFREAIVSRLRVPPDKSSELHNAVANLGIHWYITTNYDQLPENALRLGRISPKVIINPRNVPALKRREKSVIKLHGDIDDPSTIVITEEDYRKYCHENRQFVDWLNGIFTSETILFLGVSFRDARLVEADQYITNYFGKYRRPPVIVLKRPKKPHQQDHAQNGSIQDDYASALEDFQFFVESFRGNNFHVLVINDYSELPFFIIDIGKELEARRLKQLEQEAIDSGLVRKFKSEALIEQDIDAKIKKLGNLFWIRAKKESTELEEFVKSNVEPITLSARSKACIAISDFISNSRQATDLQKAWEYLEKATEITDQIEDKRDLHKRLNRLRAKLLWYEEMPDKALESIANDLSEPKTRSLWLLILADTGRYPEADEFIESHDIHMRWAEAALFVLCRSGKIEKAKDFYAKAIAQHKEFLAPEDKGSIETDVEDFGATLKASFAFYIIPAVIEETRKDKGAGLFPEELEKEQKEGLLEALELVKDLLDEQRTADLSQHRSKALAALVELEASHLLGNKDRADEVAHHLLRSGVITEGVGSYIISRSECFSKDDLRGLLNYLEAHYGEEPWSLIQRAGIHAFEFEEPDTSWDLLLKTKKLLKEKDDKVKWLDLLFSIGQKLGRLDDIDRLFKKVLPKEGVHFRFFNGRLAQICGDHKTAEKQFISIVNDSGAPKIDVFQSLTNLSEIKEKEGILDEAQKYLERALDIHFNPLIIRGQLLRVLIKQNNTKAIFEQCQKLEQIGKADESTLEWQGQAAYAMDMLEESEEAYKILSNKYGLTPERARKLALAVGRQGKHRIREAVEILEPYIQDKKQFDSECLEVAVELQLIAGDEDAAWRLLDEHFKESENNIRLLAKIMDIGFRTDHETKAHQAMIRLIQLQEEKSASGENAEPILWKVTIPEVIEITKRRQEAIDRATRLYLAGDLPRWLATDVFGMTLHQDWAVRTQPLSVLPEDPIQRARYVTYSTPGMRLTDRKGRPNWLSFEIPPDIREIVVDAHALITLYRLGLLTLMDQRFDRIYYPRVFHDIWAQERMKYRHHQKSEADASREIVLRLDRNEIAEIETPTNDQAEPNEDRLLKDVGLSESEGCPLVNAFASSEHFPGNIKVPVIRLCQLASWLLSAGKLSSTKHDRVSSVQEAAMMTTEAVEEQLDRATALLISLGTLSEICKLDILTELLASGKKIILEATSGRIVRWSITELEFVQETGREQEKIEEFLNNSHVFVGQPVTKHVDTDKPGHELGYLGLMSTINLAIEKQLHICTDDRALQRFADPKWSGATFGTDALLGDLYSKNILNIEEYTECFLKMCKWRYRFLIPDIQILVHLAREYRASPPGKGLQDFADYWDDCQQDAGLPLAVPPGQMIVPLGVKIWMAWHDAWVNMLIQLWEQEPQACREWLEKLTDAVLVELLPSPPAALIESVASNIMELQERSVFTHIFIAMSHSEHPEKLQPLASQTARLLLGNEDKVWQEAKEFLGWLSERAPQATDWMKICTLNVMKGLTGGTLDVIPRDLVPELERLGITPTEHAQSVQSEALKKAITEARERLTE